MTKKKHPYKIGVEEARAIALTIPDYSKFNLTRKGDKYMSEIDIAEIPKLIEVINQNRLKTKRFPISVGEYPTNTMKLKRLILEYSRLYQPSAS